MDPRKNRLGGHSRPPSFPKQLSPSGEERRDVDETPEGTRFLTGRKKRLLEAETGTGTFAEIPVTPLPHHYEEDARR
jgi:hypothetical protein